MKGDRILNKKMQRLNILKGNLVSRNCEDKEEIIKEISDTVDDLELILDDVNESDKENLENIETED